MEMSWPFCKTILIAVGKSRRHGIKQEFLKQVRESGDHCPCQEKCPHHGNCFECVTLHRGHRDHLPMCMWDMLNERIAALSHMTEGTLYEYEKKQAACTDCEGCPGCGE